MAILVIAEHNHSCLATASLNAVTAAQKLGDHIDIVVVGHDCKDVAEQAASISGVTHVLYADDACFSHQIAENMTSLLVNLASGYSHILAGSGVFAKNLLPRIAALLDRQQISDIVKIESPSRFVRPIYAGNALATVESQETPLLLTVRTTAFDMALEGESKAEIKKIDGGEEKSGIEFMTNRLTSSERPELTSAKIVISGGRGMQASENFQLLEKIADKLHAAVGASRAAVDSGFVPNDYQVGQTGKIVAPDLYIAVGISGAIQHLAGMKDSKTIVAINNDEDAPIFQIADYGLVEDLFVSLPKLEKAL